MKFIASFFIAVLWHYGASAAINTPRASVQTSAATCESEAASIPGMTKDGVTALCAGMKAIGPAECYAMALQKAVLSKAQKIRLCRCANSSAPVFCFLNERLSSASAENRIALCRTSRYDPALNQCVPLAGPT